jgi:hypothetical protein
LVLAFFGFSLVLLIQSQTGLFCCEPTRVACEWSETNQIDLSSFPQLVFTRNTKAIRTEGTLSYGQQCFFDEISQAFEFVPPLRNYYRADPLFAQRLNIVVSDRVAYGRCFGAFIANREYSERNSYLSCKADPFFAHANQSNNTLYYDVDVAIANSLVWVALFQHIMITGATQAGLLLPWVLQNLSSRAMACHSFLCLQLRHVLPIRNIIDLSLFPPLQVVKFRSILHAYVADNHTDNVYPVGSLWYFDSLKLPLPFRAQPSLLFLSRDENAMNASATFPAPLRRRCLKEEYLLREAVSKWAESVAWK